MDIIARSSGYQMNRGREPMSSYAVRDPPCQPILGSDLEVPIDGLEGLDGVLLDGLEFCRVAYDALEAIQAQSDGVKELQAHKTRRVKKLLEEVLPLAAFIQATYKPGCRMQVRWLGGNQPYDAEAVYRGVLVDRGMVEAEQYLEVTTAEQENEYLVRERLATIGGAFSALGTWRDPKTREVHSAPVAVEHSDELARLAALIVARVRDKAAHDYPDKTTLVVYCNLGSVILEDEWSEIVTAVRQALTVETIPFIEVSLVHLGNGLARVRRRAS